MMAFTKASGPICHSRKIDRITAAGLLPLALIIVPLAPVEAQQTADPSGGFRLEPTPTPSPAPGPIVAPLPLPAPAPSSPSVQTPVLVQPSPTPRPSPTTRTPAVRAPVTRPTPRAAPTSTAQRVPASQPSPAAEDTQTAVQPAPSARILAPDDIVESAPATTQPSLSTPSSAAPTPPAAATEAGGTTFWPWLIAALLLLGGGGYWWRRNAAASRTEEPAEEIDEIADAASVEAPTGLPDPAHAPLQDPGPEPQAPEHAAPDHPAGERERLPAGTVSSGNRPAPSTGTVRAFSGLTRASALPAPSPSPPAGIVTSRMTAAPAGKPEIAIGFEVLGAEQTETQFLVRYRLWLHNSGPAPADSGTLRLDILPGGPDTQTQVDRFFLRQQQTAQTVAIPAMRPSSRTPVEGEMRVPLDTAISFRMDGRQVIIPLAAADLDYRWNGGQARSEATFVLGRVGATGQERLGPINIDLGPRLVHGIGSKQV